MKQVLFATNTPPAPTVHRFTAAAHTFSGLQQLRDLRAIPQYFIGSEVVDKRKVRLSFTPEFKQLSGAERGRYRWYFERCGASGASEDMKGGRCFYQYKANSEADAKQIAKFHNDLLALARLGELSTDDTVTTNPAYAASGQVIKPSEGSLVSFLRPYDKVKAQQARDEQTLQSNHETQLQEQATNRAQLAEQEEKSKASTTASKASRYAALAILAAALIGLALFAILKKKKH
ncbi:MAG: hypothetical protein IJU81_02540 [Bacteroidales bacterium]|nr:hypothetical protein [Bacteroidales bacterium]